MSTLEESLVRRYSGARIAAVSAAVALGGVLPLLLYIAFGPAGGNPIGLGLLAVVAVPIGLMGVLIGLITMAVQYFTRGRQ